jgi:YfiH family protein
MPFIEVGAIRYYVFDLLSQAGVTHAVFTRRGGLSPKPWDSLNVGGLVGDDLERVKANRRLAFLALERAPQTVYDVWQVHSADVVCTEEPRLPDVPPRKADVILTNRPEVTLFMRFADCVPVLLYDPQEKVVGLAHAGWLGTVRRTVAAAIQAMQARYGSRVEEIVAGIGPSIGAHHYPVGPEVVAQVRESFGEDARSLLQPLDGQYPNEGKMLFDLWAANALILRQCGVRHIEVSAICTACHLEDWYSHRAEKGLTGRFGALICL